MFGRSGFLINGDELRVRQEDGWVCIRLSAVAEIKKPSLVKTVVRLDSGQMMLLDLSRLGVKQFSTVTAALKAAVHDKRVKAAKNEGRPSASSEQLDGAH